MPWEETSPGHFERSLDPSEAFFNLLYGLPAPPGRERWGMFGVAQFMTDLPSADVPQALRKAWKTMRYLHPVLAAALEKDRKVYEVPTEATLEEWLDATIVIEAEDADPDIIHATHQTTPLSKLHYLPGSSTIMMRISHWRSDGIGLCMLINAFFDALTSPRDVTFGDEGARLSPSFEEASGVGEVTDEKKALIREKWTKGLQGGKSITVPLNGFAISKGTYRKTHVFSEQTTSAIVSACKSRGASVTTALSAALMLAVREHEDAEPEQRGKRMSYLPYFNLRPFLSPPFNGPEHAASMMVVSEPISIELLDFDESLKQIAPFYSRESAQKLVPLVGAWNQFHSLVLTPQPPKPAAAAAASADNSAGKAANAPADKSADKPADKPSEKPADKPAAAAAPPPKPATTPALNSIGKLDPYIKATYDGKHHFEISDFQIAVEILGPVLLCYAWTFRGRLRLTLHYNEAFFAPEFVQKFLDSFRSKLLGGLGVTED